MQFVAIDIETANPYIGSICQVGIAKFGDGTLTDEWSTLVDPEDYFHAVNIAIHGIEPSMVRGQPKLPDIAEKLRAYLEGTLSVCHTHFDRVALDCAFDKYALQPISTSWLDSARVVRRTWKDLAWSGYGLASVCKKLGYKFRHHDALEDAKAAGYVLLAALRESQQDLEAWQRRVNQPIDPERASSGAAICRDGNPEGDLFGEVMVFTGALALPRNEAADLAASIGCQVGQNVTKKTTILVVGDQDVSKLAGHEKSSKHRKAEELAGEGHLIRIIRETDFKALVRSAHSNTSDNAIAYVDRTRVRPSIEPLTVKAAFAAHMPSAGQGESSHSFATECEAPVKLWTRVTNQGIFIGAGEESPGHIEPSPKASQESPKGWYVYGHFDKHGVPFYIGTGQGRRAWGKGRDSLWQRYVEKHLNGKYSVLILADDLAHDEAETLESEWIAQESDTLINWYNAGRKTDFAACDKYHKLRDENRRLAADARGQEKPNPEGAIRQYFQALANLDAYATIKTEFGLVGTLLDEENQEHGISGDIEILDRLTLCLVRAGRADEAASVAQQYFTKYRVDETCAAAARIKVRVGKAAQNAR